MTALVTMAKSSNRLGESCFYLKLQGERFEINIALESDDIELFPLVKSADWDARKSVKIGKCSGIPVFWCSTETELSILVGEDDETWDFAVTLPVSVSDEIQREIQRLVSDV